MEPKVAFVSGQLGCTIDLCRVICNEILSYLCSVILCNLDSASLTNFSSLFLVHHNICSKVIIINCFLCGKKSSETLICTISINSQSISADTIGLILRVSKLRLEEFR